ncbi:NAD-dependent succinate-semialdehyde dehydrogenase [Pseudomonas abietaniphila]
MSYPNTQLYINGSWRDASNKKTLEIISPADGSAIGSVAHASVDDLDLALSAALQGFLIWKETPAFARAKVMHHAATLVRERFESIARLMTLEQGKPLAESRAETLAAADIIDWFASEAVRAYGRVIPSRSRHVAQMVIREPVGPVAAFAPWNFPLNQIVRKICAALAAGCSIIAKAPEETPASPAALVQAFADAGIPAGVINLVFGDPAHISSYLIAHPVIQKVTFTGSTPVGKQLAGMAGTHMKRMSMELGGHAPVIVCADADITVAARTMATSKFRNAGQVCISPTRFVIHSSVYERFAQEFVAHAKSIRVGHGLSPETNMGPLANSRRLAAMKAFTEDAIACGAELLCGGAQVGTQGCFFQPTVLGKVPVTAKAMNEEPFGPLALLSSFEDLDEALAEANRLPYGLAAYAYTRSSSTSHRLIQGVESGMLSINHAGLALPETPNGGIKDSGHGAEGGSEAIESYLNSKFVTQANA